MRRVAPTATPTFRRHGRLRASMFPDLQSGAGNSTGPGVEEWPLEGLQKEDPLAIQVWRLCARIKANLPHAQQMGNLAWRMVRVSLRWKIQLEEQI